MSGASPVVADDTFRKRYRPAASASAGVTLRWSAFAFVTQAVPIPLHDSPWRGQRNGAGEGCHQAQGSLSVQRWTFSRPSVSGKVRYPALAPKWRSPHPLVALVGRNVH
eukprot:1334919-Amphidinium_carterae.1